MWTDIVKFGPLLAGASALIALLLGFTRSAILRRQEQTLREIRESLPAGTPQHAAIDDLHRGTVGRLIARQLHGTWPFIWPWLIWLTLAGVSAQTGYHLAEYLVTKDDFDLDEFSYKVLGGDWQTLILAPFVLLALAWVFKAYEHSLLERARTARSYYNTGRIAYTRALRPYNHHHELRWRSRLERVAHFAPAPLAVSLGLLVGNFIYSAATDVDRDTRLPTLVPLSMYEAFPTVLLALATIVLIGGVRERRAHIDQLPRPKLTKRQRRNRLRQRRKDGAI